MKKPFILATAAAIFLGSPLPVYCQEFVRETTTAVQPVEVAGTVTEYTPEGIVLRSETSTAPVRYGFSKTTEYVDEDGNRVTMDVVRSGAPVTVRYIHEGGRMIANRVIVRRSTVTAPAIPPVTVRKSTTTTTTTTRERDDD